MINNRLPCLFLIYDERGINDPDNAAVLVACSSLQECRSYRGQWGRCAVYRYDVQGEELINETLVEVME